MLKALGRRVTRLFHGDARSRDGLLLTRRHYIEEDQEWRLGWACIGLLGFVLFVAILVYVRIAYDHLPRIGGGNRIRLGHWSDLTLELKILIPLAIAGHLFGMVSAVRLWLVRGEIADQRREDLGE